MDYGKSNNTNVDHLSGLQPGSLWYAVLVTECTVIFVINAFTIIVFARNRHLCKRTTYLIINLTVADLLTGGVSGPLEMFYVEIDLKAGFSWRNFISVTFLSIFTISSLFNLSLISLERLHATIYPFRHCLIGSMVYCKAVICTWLLALSLSCLDAVIFLFIPVAFFYVWASHIVFTLLILTVSYVIIIVKVLNNPPPQPFGSIASDRKLSVTLFLVTIVSILTILPWAIYAVIDPLSIWNKRSRSREMYIVRYIVFALYYACSIANPLIYAIRMKEFRKAVCKELTCKKTTESSQISPNELHII